jgi:hypothetical protein
VAQTQPRWSFITQHGLRKFVDVNKLEFTNKVSKLLLKSAVISSEFRNFL